MGLRKSIHHPHSSKVRESFFINDVGESTWEEIDGRRSRQKNYGLAHPPKGAFINQKLVPELYRASLYLSAPQRSRVQSSAGAFYNPTNVTFPRNNTSARYFFMDFFEPAKCSRWTLAPRAVSTFGTGLAFPDGMKLSNERLDLLLGAPAARRQRPAGHPARARVYRIQYTLGVCADDRDPSRRNQLASVGYPVTFNRQRFGHIGRFSFSVAAQPWSIFPAPPSDTYTIPQHRARR